MSDESGIRFWRKRTWHDATRSYELEVDGQKVGQLPPSGELVVPVQPGQHRCRAHIDWTGSPELTFDVPEGRTLSVLIKPPFGFGRKRVLSEDRYLTLTVTEA